MSQLEDTVGDDGGAASDAGRLVGTTLGAYRIERLLGEGAMGEVFLATHVALGRPVALKTLKPGIAADRALTERFFAEARAVNIIRHENIVECTDLVNDPSGRSYIVMELLEGRTLGAAIRDAGRLPARRAARIIAQIADAIGAAHDKGIVHRDLKPENVYLIRRAGSTDYVKVLDFGIARLRPELGGVSATQSGALIGTPAYMSPEQVRGERAGPSADIYALGVILFHMLTGRIPFDAASMSMMLVAQLQQTPPRVDQLVPETPRPLADLVASTLAKDPAGRPRSMAVFRNAVLEAAGLPAESTASVIESSPSVARAMPVAASGFDPTIAPSIGQSSISAGAAEVVHGKPRARRWLYAAVAVIAVGGLVTVFAVRSSSDDAPPQQPQQASLPAPPPRVTANPPVAPPAPAEDIEQKNFDAERSPDKIVGALGIEPGMRVAEIGAGTGLLTVHIARAVGTDGKVVATVGDDGVLHQLDARIAKAGLTGVVEGRVKEAELDDGYDVILVAHATDPNVWIGVAKRRLKPSGRLALGSSAHARPETIAAAEKAGLALRSDAMISSGHYLAVFTVNAPKLVPVPNADVKLRYACAPMGKQGHGGCLCGDGYVSKQQAGVWVCAPAPKAEPVKTEPPKEPAKGDRTKTLVDPSKPSE
jgi:eukaryotic-like serine/threonine-protein kinase